MTVAAHAPAPEMTLRRHVAMTVRLAAPVVAARLGVMLIPVEDVAMTGRYASSELAELGMATTLGVPLLLLGIGLLVSVSVLTSQADGAGTPEEGGPIWRAGIKIAFGAAIAFMALCAFGEWFLLAIGQEAALAAGAQPVLTLFALGLPGLLIGVATLFFLEGIGRPMPGMVLMIFANIANIGLNWLLIEGRWGWPAMGAEGAMLGSTITRTGVAVAAVIYVLNMSDAARYRVRGSFKGLERLVAKLLRIGAPMSATQGMETSAFMVAGLLAGYLGQNQLAAYHITLNMTALAFMAAVGFGAATGVRTGRAVGRGDTPGRRMAGWVGAGLCAFALGLVAIVFLTAGEAVVALYTSDPAVAPIAVVGLMVTGVFLVFDGLQVVFISALRGAGDVWTPLATQFAALWLVGLPLGAWLAFEGGYLGPGLVLGTMVGIVVSACLNGARFHILSKRDVGRL